MSIHLTTQVLSIQDLTQSEKHVLTVLCFRSNEKYEVYSSIERLTNDCSCSVNTIERALKGLRDKKYLTYTGKLAPKSKSIPIYSINLTHPQNEGGLSLRTPILNLTHPQNGDLRTPKMGIRIDNIKKDNKKDICLSAHATSTPKTQKERTPNGAKHISQMLKGLSVMVNDVTDTPID